MANMLIWLVFFYFHNAQLGIRSQIFHPFFTLRSIWTACETHAIACHASTLHVPLLGYQLQTEWFFFFILFFSRYIGNRAHNHWWCWMMTTSRRRKKKRQWKKGKRSWESLINNNMRFSVVHSIPIKLEYKCADTWCYCGDADGMRGQRNVHSVWRSCVSSGVT